MKPRYFVVYLNSKDETNHRRNNCFKQSYVQGIKPDLHVEIILANAYYT